MFISIWSPTTLLLITFVSFVDSCLSLPLSVNSIPSLQERIKGLVLDELKDWLTTFVFQLGFDQR